MRRQIVKQLKADPSTLSRSRLEFPSESNPHNDGLKLSATFSFGREKAATRLKPTKKRERKREGQGEQRKPDKKPKSILLIAQIRSTVKQTGKYEGTKATAKASRVREKEEERCRLQVKERTDDLVLENFGALRFNLLGLITINE